MQHPKSSDIWRDEVEFEELVYLCPTRQTDIVVALLNQSTHSIYLLTAFTFSSLSRSRSFAEQTRRTSLSLSLLRLSLRDEFKC